MGETDVSLAAKRPSESEGPFTRSAFCAHSAERNPNSKISACPGSACLDLVGIGSWSFATGLAPAKSCGPPRPLAGQRTDGKPAGKTCGGWTP